MHPAVGEVRVPLLQPRDRDGCRDNQKRVPDASRLGLPRVAGLTRDAIYEGKLGPGGLYLAAQMSRRMGLTTGQRVLDLGTLALTAVALAAQVSPYPL